MRPAIPPGYNFWILNIPAYLTVLAIVYPVLIGIPPGNLLWSMAILLVVFAVLITAALFTVERPLLANLYLAIQTVLIIVGFTSVPEQAHNIQILFFILSAQAMLILPIKIAWLWIIAYSVITVVGGGIIFGWALMLQRMASVGGYIFFGLFGAMQRRAIAAQQESQRLLGELQETYDQLQVASKQAQQLAVSEERNRLARELHDSLGHRLTVAIVQLEGARRLIPSAPERAGSMVESMRLQLKDSLAELRQAVSTLRSPQDELNRIDDLKTAVSTLVHTFKDATGLPVHLSIDANITDMPQPHRRAIYRAAQESLTNVQRHASATQIWLTLRQENGRITLTTADDGQGYPEVVEDGRFGLQGLRERAEALKGSLHLTTSSSGGAQLQFTLPCPQTTEPHHA